ncbi:MAG TPA: response regulator [Vicinamibacterales bacterium]|nr:response regulator [Vicinamibacterales bacterium]
MNEAPGRRVSVLLVDDCDDQRDLYELLLASEFTVISAGRGAAALALAERWRPDVIVLDIEMPDMNGFETCRRLKDGASTRAIPVIMLTGCDYIPDEARLAGASLVLAKPCPERRLVEAIVAAASGVRP